MNTRILTAIAFAGATLAGPVSAATQTWLQNTSTYWKEYWDTSYWSPAAAPGASNAANFDFIVNGGKEFRIGYLSGGAEAGKGTSWTFAGASLQLGDANYATQGNLSTKGPNAIVTFPNLKLYKGWLANGGNGTLDLKGNATVYSKADAPYTIAFRTGWDGRFYMTLTGDEDSVVNINQNTDAGKTAWVYTYADQSKTYSGSWLIRQNVQFRPSYTGKDGWVNSTSAQVFGKPLTTFNPAALKMQNGSVMRYEAKDRNFAASDNRGLTVDAEGGQVTFMMINGNGYTFSWPITGKGTFRVNGDGNFHLYSSCTVPLKADGSATKIYLRPGASATGGYSNTTGRPIYALFSPNGGTLKTVRVGGTIPEGQKLALGFTAQTNVTKVTDIPLVVIDKNVSRTLTEDDFDPWGVPDYQIVNADRVVFSTNAQGETVVSVRLFPYVTSKTNPRLNDGSTWENGQVPSSGHNYYVIAGTEFRTGYGESDDNIRTAPGDRWVFGKGSTYVIKETKITFPFGRLLGGNSFRCGQSINKAWELAGTVDLRQLFGDHVVLAGDGVRDFTVSAKLSGNGAIWAQGQSRSYHWGDQNIPVCPHNLIYSGDNSGFKGTFFATNTSFVAGYPLQLKAASEKNFGGNPEKFSAEAWKLGHGVVFMPTADVTFDDANRGVTFLSGSSVNTAGGDFTVKTPVVFGGTFTKSGAGTFAFGEGGVTYGSGATISVEEGAIRAAVPNGLKGAAVSFAEDGVLALDATGEPIDLTATTLSKTGAKYRLRIDGLQSAMVTVATFADADAASAFVAATKTVRNAEGCCGRLVAEGNEVKAYRSGGAIIVK